MSDLLLEIGCEELPPAAIAPVLEQLGRDTRAAAERARLDVGEVRTTGTVRRLTLMAEGVAQAQRDLVTEVRGPAQKIAFDLEGRPTRAAEGFARAQGVPLEALRVREIDGGRYVVAEKREAGRPAAEVLAGVIPLVVAGLAFPKTMRWEASGFRFGRPIRWIVAILDGRVVPLQIAGVRAGRRTYGHRFLAPRAFTVARPGEYGRVIARARVVLDPEARRARILEGATRLAAEIGGRPLLDPALLDELVWSVEHPVPLRGTLDEEFVETLPRAVLLVTLQHHQKYFGVEDPSGGLMPAFVAVRDGGTGHLATVRTGHEWVVRARLADARFFLEEDGRGTFSEWNAQLERVAHAAGLGSMADHVRRVMRVAEWLAGAARLTPADRAALLRAAELCKADLVTAMVGEFPELQGTMGGIYARWAGEPEAVAAAIESQYQPRGTGDALPPTLHGALLGIADRAALLAGCVLAGAEPSGSQDPHGLRRASGGISAILLAIGLRVSARDIFAVAAATFDATPEDRGRAAEASADMVRQRLRTTLMDQGLAYDTVDAALAVAGDDVPDAAARARALQEIRAQPIMARLATGFSRASRILSQGVAAEHIDEALLREPAERALHLAWQKVGAAASRAVEAGAYAEALGALAELADPVDAFFDQVLVMAPDAQVRANRLALLREVTDTFLRVADFGMLSG